MDVDDSEDWDDEEDWDGDDDDEDYYDEGYEAGYDQGRAATLDEERKRLETVARPIATLSFLMLLAGLVVLAAAFVGVLALHTRFWAYGLMGVGAVGFWVADHILPHSS